MYSIAQVISLTPGIMIIEIKISKLSIDELLICGNVARKFDE